MASPSDQRADAADGRHRRSARSRAQIVEALLALVRDGDMSPSAARVAEAAGVSLRTVFRHFEEMDSLYREMTERIAAEVMPEVAKPFVAAGWRDRLDELVRRRAAIYERIFPFRVSGALRRFQSAYLMEDHRRTVALERAALMAILPDPVLADRPLLDALDLATGFASWRRLRQDQGLGAAAAEAVVRLTVDRLLPRR
jgi:AcrR family transcriptional regulator